jgi:predicted hydrocarbon binding protein
MNIYTSAVHHPVCDIQLSDIQMRWALLAVEEVAGRQGAEIVLRQAGLEKLIGHYPNGQVEFSGAYTFADYGHLNNGLLNFFGRGGRSMVMRIGRISYKLAMERYSAFIGAAALTALRLLPEDKRIKVGLELMKITWDRLYSSHGLSPLQIRMEDRGDRVAYILHDCLACAGQEADAPMCYVAGGLFQEAMRWMTNREYDIRETECRAMGAPACVWEVSKMPKDL